MSSRYDRDREYDSRDRREGGGGSDRRDRDRDRDRSRRDEDDGGKEDRGGRYDREERDRHSSRKRDRSDSRDRSHKKEKKDKDRKEKKHRDRSSSPPSAKSTRKAEKAARRREEELQAARQVAELSMYSAEDNPFHDANLGQQFSWTKKREKEKKAGITDEEATRRDQVRSLQAKEELERLNKRRADREVEMALREEEESRMARMAESAQMAEWVAKEDDFHLEQSRRRAGIRMRENRAKAIDFLAINLRFADPESQEKSALNDEEDDGWGWEDAGLEWEIDEPWLIFDNLTMDDTEELYTDIRMYLSLEKSATNIEFWECMSTICKDRLYTLRRSLDPSLRAAQGDTSNEAVQADIAHLLDGKTHDQLIKLEGGIRDKLSSREPVDVDFYEAVLRNLDVWKAKAKLHQIHLVVIQNRLEQLRQRQREQALKVQEELGGTLAEATEAVAGRAIRQDAIDEALAADKEAEVVEEVEEYSREMSPEVVAHKSLSSDDRGLPIVNEEDDMRALYAARRLVTSTSFIPRAVRADNAIDNASAPSFADLAAERLYKDEAAKNLDEDEEFFNLEEGLENPGTYSWEDKFRPRKPRFFNRVHTGFEWNKYNQTHYDSDNPPPKVVQGYKFNIFYPDLLDKSVAPSYKFVRNKSDPDTCLLIFTAGPPYEDIAFRIVDKEWEYSHKRGFRSSFDRGVLQLYFNFRRQFYRK